MELLLFIVVLIVWFYYGQKINVLEDRLKKLESLGAYTPKSSSKLPPIPPAV